MLRIMHARTCTHTRIARVCSHCLLPGAVRAAGFKMEAPFAVFKIELQEQLDAHVENLRRLIHQFCEQELAPVDAQGARASPDPGTSVVAPPIADNQPADPAFAIAVGLARQALQDSELRIPPSDTFAKALQQLGEARNMLQVPAGGVPSTKQTAKAYATVWEARDLVRVCGSVVEKPVKVAALAVREFLTLQCGTGGTKSAFEAALIDAFDRDLESIFNSQFHLCRTSITRLAHGGMANFRNKVPSIFGREVSEDDCKQLFAAYCCVASISASPTAPGARATRPATKRGPDPLKWLPDPLKISMPNNRMMPSGQAIGDAEWPFGYCGYCGCYCGY